MREPALGLKTSALNGGSFLKRIHENLQSVWRLTSLVAGEPRMLSDPLPRPNWLASASAQMAARSRRGKPR
jgi:hypothetical protein